MCRTSGHFHDQTFQCAIAEFGIDRIMFSVDYPFEETAMGSEWFYGKPLTEADWIKIGRTNATGLFGLDLDR